MKINRMCTMIMMLLSRKTISAPELAKVFNVSVRTIYRDAEELKKMGIPLVATPGLSGGLSISPVYKTEKHISNMDDVESLIIDINSDELSSESPYSAAMKRVREALALLPDEDEPAITVTLRYDAQHEYAVFLLFGDRIVDSRQEDCTLRVSIPDNDAGYALLLLNSNMFECIAPESLRSYLISRIREMRLIYGID